ncbi:DUF2795 domain-containing protein [Streptomyces minutiscleroticus]|uniref:DUF2795 domain-containing protein n=1 Tax=Streptomyces minutiscleroticus TaxID=68238 RepID=A0A918NQI5_9ACTN|nr:DUF2795 domain-containing protein [Streptomyces minutiscleroticus]GGX87549.1 hypothetical protein GCM10010358_46890 [Streptomyces minutiscleroticus]
MNVNPIELQKCLGGMNYPADKKTVVDQAKQHGADKEIMGALEALPDKEYGTPAEINKEVNRHT